MNGGGRSLLTTIDVTEPSRYGILRNLGRGGMGEVFLADDYQLGRKVAIKFLGEALDADRTARERLLREARSAAALDHPYICKIFEVADIDGLYGHRDGARRRRDGAGSSCGVDHWHPARRW